MFCPKQCRLLHDPWLDVYETAHFLYMALSHNADNIYHRQAKNDLSCDAHSRIQLHFQVAPQLTTKFMYKYKNIK